MLSLDFSSVYLVSFLVCRRYKLQLLLLFLPVGGAGRTETSGAAVVTQDTGWAWFLVPCVNDAVSLFTQKTKGTDLTKDFKLQVFLILLNFTLQI